MQERSIVTRSQATPCLKLRYTREQWDADDQALKAGDNPLSCPCGSQAGCYAPRHDGVARWYRACKFCGFWQDVNQPPHRIIRYECFDRDHYVADWKEPHESWTCPCCARTFDPTMAVPWPADSKCHLWHALPQAGSQASYRHFWESLLGKAPPFGIV